MLLKLIKYDFKATFPKLLISSIIYAVLGIIAPLVIFPFNQIASMITVSITVGMGILAYCLAIFIFLFQYYRKNIYGEEGYLMSTLPTSGYKLLLSKSIVAIIWDLISSIIIIGSVFVLVFVISKGFENANIDINWQHILSNAEIVTTVIYTIIGIIASSLFILMAIYFSISVAQLPVWGKVGTLMGFVTFIVVSIISDIPGFFLSKSLFVGKSYQIADTNAALSLLFKSGADITTLISSIIEIAMTVGLFFLTGWLIDRKISLK